MSNANYNTRANVQLVTATVTGEVAIRTTQYGDKAVIDCTLPNGAIATIWDDLDENDESVLLDLAIGQSVSLYQNKNNNWKINKKGMNKKTTKPALTIAPPNITYNINNEDHPVRKQARLLRDCVDAVLIEFHGIALSDEVIQKYATSLFISITKN